MNFTNLVKPFMRFSRLTRVRVYIQNLEDTYNPSQIKIKKVQVVKEQLDKTLIKASVASWLRNFFNLIIYASLISAVSTLVTGVDLSFLSEQIRWVTGIIGGTTVAVIGASVSSRFVNLYLVDLQLLATTIISVYISPEDDIDKIDAFNPVKDSK
jgi:hypothetical protein